MTSTYTPLGVELMVTGENAGTWGTKTNTNLNIIEQISGGYATQAIAGSGTTAFTKTDGGTGSLVATRVTYLYLSYYKRVSPLVVQELNTSCYNES